jgi:hypothetical protein
MLALLGVTALVVVAWKGESVLASVKDTALDLAGVAVLGLGAGLLVYSARV